MPYQQLARRAHAAVERAETLGDAVGENLAATFERLQQQAGEIAELRQKVANLEVALGTSRLIGQAIGIVMVRRRMTEDDAFTLLREASQQLRRKVRDIASEVVLTGEIPSEAA